MSKLLGPPRRPAASPAGRRAVTFLRSLRRMLPSAACLLLAGCAAGSLPPADIRLQAHIARAGAMIDQIGNRLDESPSAPDAQAVALYALALQETEVAIALAEKRREAATRPVARTISADILGSVVACRAAIQAMRRLHEQAALNREVFDLAGVDRTCAMAAETDALLASVEGGRP